MAVFAINQSKRARVTIEFFVHLVSNSTLRVFRLDLHKLMHTRMHIYLLAKQIEESVRKSYGWTLHRILHLGFTDVSHIWLSSGTKFPCTSWKLEQQIRFGLLNVNSFCLHFLIQKRRKPRTLSLKSKRIEKSVFHFAISGTKLIIQQMSYFRAHIFGTGYRLEESRFSGSGAKMSIHAGCSTSDWTIFSGSQHRYYKRERITIQMIARNRRDKVQQNMYR